MSTYLVTMATGQQGYFTVQNLLAAGASVHAIVRDPSKEAARALDLPGVTIFKGENEDSEAVFRAAQGCKGVFINTFPWYGDNESEGRQAKSVIEACKRAGIEIAVASTSICTGNRALWDGTSEGQQQVRGYYLSKTKIEDAVRGAGFNAFTILRPAYIHSDFLLPRAYGNFPELPKSGELAHPCNDGVRMLYVAPQDIGKYAAAALLDPTKFNGQEIELAGEALTIENVRDAIKKATGRDVPIRKRTPAQIEEAKVTVFGQKFLLWANELDLKADPKPTEGKFGIPFTSLEAYLQEEKSQLLDCLNTSTKQ